MSSSVGEPDDERSCGVHAMRSGTTLVIGLLLMAILLAGALQFFLLAR
jgi:hypothetical protein